MFDLTPGAFMFYGGIAGAIIVAIIAIIVIISLSGSKKRLRRQLNDEYKGSRR